MAAATSGVNRSVAPAWTAGIQLGSLISVISLSEIRYEGFLIELTPHPFTIGLRNVRLLGTEGRKKSGRQIPPSDKIYEYIYLRGNNIKNLWVISSPSTQSNLLVPEDPAIIRPSIAQPAPTTMASISHGVVGANVRNSAQPILPGTSSFQFNQSRITMGSTSHGATGGANVRNSAQPILPGTSSFQFNQSRITMGSASHGAAEGANVRNSAQPILPGTSSFQFNQSRITMGSASHGAAEGANVRNSAQPILPGTPSFQFNQSHITMGSTSHGAAEGANVRTRAQPILPGASSFQSNQSRITMGSTSHGAAQGANVRTRAQPILPGTSSFQFNQSRITMGSTSHGAAEGANVRTRAQPILPGASSFQSNQSRITMGSTSHGAAQGANVRTRAQPILPGTSSFQFNQSRITMESTSHGAAEGANVRTRAQPILPGTSFQFNQSRDPSASSSSVQRSLLPPPPANNSRLAVPNYLQALAGSSGMMSHFQQKLPTPPASLVASKAPVQQQVQRHNANTSAVGESTFFARHPPLLLRHSATSSNAVPPLVSTPSVQSNLGKSSPSQSLQIKDTKGKAPLAPVMALNFKKKAALAPVMESLPSGSTEETLGSSLKQTTETGSIPSHHEKGQSSQGKEQVHGGPNEDPGRSLEGENEKPLVKRGYKEDFNFEAMNKKFNKEEVWDYFSKSKGEAGGVRDNTKPLYCKEEFFDSLSYGATDDESAKVRLSEQKDEETFGAEIPIIQEHRGPRKQVWRRIVK